MLQYPSPFDSCRIDVVVLELYDLINQESYTTINNIELIDFNFKDVKHESVELIIFNAYGETKILKNRYGSIGVILTPYTTPKELLVKAEDFDEISKSIDKDILEKLIQLGKLKKESKVEDLGYKKFEVYQPIKGDEKGVFPTAAPNYNFGITPGKERFDTLLRQDNDFSPPPDSKL